MLVSLRPLVGEHRVNSTLASSPVSLLTDSLSALQVPTSTTLRSERDLAHESARIVKVGDPAHWETCEYGVRYLSTEAGGCPRVRCLTLVYLRAPVSFQAPGSSPAASKALMASPSRKGSRPSWAAFAIPTCRTAISQARPKA